VGAILSVAALALVAFSGGNARLGPFFWVWIVLLVPTLFFWHALVVCVVSLTSSRAVTYAIGLGLLFATAGMQLRRMTTWVTCWTLWGSLRWSGFGNFQLDRSTLARR
jgi:hypothetical protein